MPDNRDVEALTVIDREIRLNRTGTVRLDTAQGICRGLGVGTFALRRLLDNGYIDVGLDMMGYPVVIVTGDGRGAIVRRAALPDDPFAGLNGERVDHDDIFGGRPHRAN